MGRCLAKNPRQRPTADGLLAEVGALQPTADWLPESIIRAFARDTPPGPASATAAKSAAPAAALAGLAAVGIAGEAATQTTAADAAAPVPSGESLLLAPAGNPQTPARGMPPAGDTYPPGDAYYQPRLAPRSVRPRLVGGTGRSAACGDRWCWWIIADMIAAGVAGFAVTSFAEGKTPAPGQSPAGLTSSAPASTAGGRGAPSVSGSASSSSSASRSASSPASAAASSSQGTSQPASASASASVHKSSSPSASPSARSSSASPSPSPPRPRLAYNRVPDADTDHIGANLVEHTHVFGIRDFGACVFGEHSIHAGEHSIIGIRFHVAAKAE